ncbi:MAG TPA: Ig-like domain-containing protein [Anaerolineales bacterium]|nr:Ig-like domain-containing protein [Anaerolineales bacterium]HRQ91447.1 Ig-like domain-containing protein [Anaerolineales bacterium]
MRGRVRDPKLSLSNRRGKTLWPALVLAGAFALGLAIPALAAYLGPDRDYTVTVTESETVRDYDNDSWTLTGPEGVCIIIHSCDEHPGTSNYIPACGWSGPADNASCTPAFKTIQVTRTETHYYPEATVSGAIQCAQNGANGWCLGSGSIELSANEPLGSYSILGIEGSLDGNNFFCSGASCSVPGSPGSAEANYWALSSYGDSSSSGSQTLKIDNDLPTIAGLVSGVQGNGGWYVGTIGLTAVGADATSGLAAQQVQVDGGGWQDTSATISSDGSYSVVFRAVDEAGQESYTAAQSLGRDSAAPTISLNMYDAPARGSALVAGAASDATSGVVAVHFSLNGSLNQTITTSGGAWQLHWDSTEVPNGDYTIQVYAEDQAGHYSAPVQVSVQVDNAVPYINLSSGCWPIWQALDLDAGPGAAPISLVSLTVSNGSQSLTEIFSTPPQGWVWNRTFSDGSVAPIGDYGLQVYVEDASGNSSSRTACISIPEPDAVGLSTEDGGAQASPLQSFVPSNERDTPPPSASFANAQPSVSVITALQPQPAFVQQLQQATPANAAVWGPAALTLAAAATAIAMAEKNRRDEEERRRNEPDPFATHPNNLLAAHLSDKEVMAQVLAAGANPNISIEQARLITHNALKGKGAYSPTGGELNEQARQAANETNMGGGANNLLAAHLSDKEVMAQVLAAGADPNISIEQARLITHNALKGKGAYSPTGGELNEQARQAANETTMGGGAYSVQAGDNWFSIAEKIYGNQRMAGQLIDANGGVSMLQPGQTIALPQVSGSEAASPNFNPKTWDEVAKFTLAQEALKKAEEEKTSTTRDRKHKKALGLIAGGVTAAALLFGYLSSLEGCGLHPQTGRLLGFQCSVAQIDSMSIYERIEWFDKVVEQTGAGDWFNNIKGILRSFADRNRAEQGSWLSIVDAHILVGIQDGYALYQSGVTPREMSLSEIELANKWALFFEALHSEDPALNAQTYPRWGDAEQTFTDHGVEQADVKPSNAEEFFLWSGNIYRSWVIKRDVIEEERQELTQWYADPACGLPPCQVFIAGKAAIIYFKLWASDPRVLLDEKHPVFWFATNLWLLEP